MGLLARLFDKLRSHYASPRTAHVTVEGMDQWVAGGIALRIIVRWMMDGGEVRRTREFIKWLSFDDLIQTEHLLILGALQALETSGDELSIGTLRARLSPEDPAGFVGLVLNQIVESRRDAPAEGSDLDRFRGVLVKLRGRREEQSKGAKLSAVNIARQILARKMNVIEGAEQLQWVEREFRHGQGHVFEIFGEIIRQTGSHPRPEQRKHWAKDALARVDRERAELAERARPEVALACQKLIEQWSHGLTSILSSNLATLLTSGTGKYLRWANQLNADSLEALLWAIGEFGRCWAAASKANGRLPEPIFYPHNMAEERMREALKVLAKLQCVGRLNLNYGPHGLSENVAAFSPEFRERLSQDAHTAWAQGMDEDSAGLLLWMVGEYGCRVNSSRGPDGGDYPPPTFDAIPEITKPMRAALGLIAKFECGDAMTATEVKGHIESSQPA